MHAHRSGSTLRPRLLQLSDPDGTALYDALGVRPTDRLPAIKAAYRRLARVHHPDKGGAAASFAKIRVAYETLSDPKKRAVYDACAGDLLHRPRAARAQARDGGLWGSRVGGGEGAAGAGPGVSGPGQAPLGGEDALLDALEGLGLTCDPSRQLVVTCESCGRPATKDCYACGAPFCDFCSRTPHWRPGVALHWPVVQSKGLQERLGRREMEEKRLEDDARAQRKDPNFRSARELDEIRAFRREAAREAAKGAEILRSGLAVASSVTETVAVGEDGLPRAIGAAAAGDGGGPAKGAAAPTAAASAAPRAVARTEQPSASLTKYYLWAQTPYEVVLAAYLPAGFRDRALVAEPSAVGLLLQSEGAPPLVDRPWGGAVDPSRPIETFATEDGRFFLAYVPKRVDAVVGAARFGGAAGAGDGGAFHAGFDPASLGGASASGSSSAPSSSTQWRSLFRNDSDGLRALQQPYALRESDDDVTLEIPLPFWTEAGDVDVAVDERGIRIAVRGGLYLKRTFYGAKDDEDDEPERAGASAERAGRRPGRGTPPSADPASSSASGTPGGDRAPSSSSPLCPVIPSASTWTLDEEWIHDERVQMLSVTLQLREPTEEETTWKRGVRADHRSASRPDGRKGRRFFLEDEDEYGLEDLVQAALFARAGKAYVPPKPWIAGSEGRVARRAQDLAPGAQALLRCFEAGAAAPEEGREAGGRPSERVAG